MTNISIHPATHELLQKFYGDAPKMSLRGYVVIEDRRVIAVVGLFVEKSRMILFAEVDPKIDRTEFRYKRQMIKLIRKILPLMKKHNLPVHSTADPKVPHSIELLEHIGFTHMVEEVYEWQC